MVGCPTLRLPDRDLHSTASAARTRLAGSIKLHSNVGIATYGSRYIQNDLPIKRHF